MKFKKIKKVEPVLSAISNEFDVVNIIKGSNVSRMSNTFGFIEKFKKNKTTKDPNLYSDCAQGLKLGIESADNIKISTAGLKLLKENIETNTWRDTETNELAGISQGFVKDIESKVLSKEDFYYGFWLGIFNTITRGK